MNHHLPLAAHLLALEQARGDAMLRADLSALKALLDEALVYVHSSGVRDSRASYLAKLESGTLRYASLALLDLQVILPTGDDGATSIVTGRMEATVIRAEVSVIVKNCYLACWARTALGWRMLGFQGTVL